jgi:DNA-directed RNA polymerase I, II, and III subunit RPABC1
MENHEDQAEITKLFKIRKTILKMLQDRGYVVEQSSLEESLDTFKKNFKGRDNIKGIMAQKKESESDKIYVEFIKNFKSDKKIGVKDISNFTSKLHLQNVPKGIMIINCPITSLAKQVISN